MNGCRRGGWPEPFRRGGRSRAKGRSREIGAVAAVLLFALAAVSVTIGGFLVALGVTEVRETRRLESWPRLSAAELRRLPPGSPGVLEGRLAEGNPELAHGLVLLTRSRLVGHRDDDGARRAVWETLATRWPALLLELEDGEVLVPEGYSVTLRGSDPSIVPAERTPAGDVERFEGLARGAPVTLLGEVGEAEGDAGPVFAAERVVSGTLDEARAGAGAGAAFGLIGGLVLLAAAVGLAVAGAASL